MGFNSAGVGLARRHLDGGRRWSGGGWGDRDEDDEGVDGVGADDDAEASPEVEQSEVDAGNEHECGGCGVDAAAGGGEVVVGGEGDRGDDHSGYAGAPLADAEEVCGDQVHGLDEDHAEEELFIEPRAESDRRAGLPGEGGELVGLADACEGEVGEDELGEGCAREEHCHKKEGQCGRAGLGCHEGEDAPADGVAMAGEDVLDEEHDDECDGGEVQACGAEGAEEACQHALGFDDLDVACGWVGEVDHRAELVEDEHREEEEEDVEGGLGGLGIGVPARIDGPTGVGIGGVRARRGHWVEG